MNRAPFHELTGQTDRTSAATHVALPRHALWGVMTWVPGENRRYHVGCERGGRGSARSGSWLWLPEGVLNRRRTSEARVSGEAPAALLPEGVLNPVN